MISEIEVTNAQGYLMTLDLRDPSSGIYVKDVEGLGPVKASIVSSPFGAMAGAQFQSSRREVRNIVFKLGLRPDYINTTAYSLRSQVYDYFEPESPVKMTFYGDNPLCGIDGIVETCEPDIFSDDPGMVVSIICVAPDFLDLDDYTVAGNTVADTTEMLINYTGRVRTGITFTLNVNRSVSSFTIYNRQQDNTIQTLDFAAALLAGDILTIDTRAGSRQVTRTRAGVSTSVLYGFAPQSKWIDLARGDNNIRVYSPGAAIPYQIVYTPRYGGL